MLDALRGSGWPVVYRPCVTRERMTPDGAVLVLAHSDVQRERLIAAGQPAQQVRVVPSPVLDSPSTLTRKQLGLAEDDFAWLLTSETGPGGNLRLAVWIGTLIHVMFRDTDPGGRRHRLVLVGDSEQHRLARRFVDQTGLPQLGVTFGSDRPADYVAAAKCCDGMLLMHNRPASAWPLRVGAAAGLKLLISGAPELREAAATVPEAAVAGIDRLEVQPAVEAALKLVARPATPHGGAFDELRGVRERWQAALSRIYSDGVQSAAASQRCGNGRRFGPAGRAGRPVSRVLSAILTGAGDKLGRAGGV